jgi:superfamily I DNA and/or RNA helicase
LKAHISEDYGDVYRQFNDMDEEGFKMVGRHPFEMWSITGALHQSLATLRSPQPITMFANILRKARVNVYSLTYQERQVLISHWVEEIHHAKVGELFEVVDGAASTQKNLDNVHAEASRRILQGADVIGLTTSGLTGRMSLLKHVACKVIICEEAGEILEPHMISALLPTVEHCIQIGDHEQLRPSVSNFEELLLESERGKQHQLDRSQFERLSIGEVGRPLVPVAQLKIQRRMRPEISTLIRETLYARLLDHNSTFNLPNVVGLRQNVF